MKNINRKSTVIAFTVSFVIVLLLTSVSSCDTSVKFEVSNDKTSEIFDKNCETVREYEKAFCQENIDYDRFYAANAIVKGTTLGAKDSMNVKERMIVHQEMWEKYDFEISKPLNLLPGVNAETKEMDGSVRMYFNLTITLTENSKSITIPMYESYDFDDSGKILFLQYYGDLTSAISSLED